MRSANRRDHRASQLAHATHRIISEQQDARKLRREAINKSFGENAVNESAVEDLEGRVKRANEAYATKKQSDALHLKSRRRWREPK